MLKARVRVPSVTRSDIWRSKWTYVILLLLLGGVLALVCDIWLRNSAAETAISVIFIAGMAALFVWHCRQSMAVYSGGLKARVEHTIHHSTTNLFCKVTVSHLLAGQGGWIATDFVGAEGDMYCIDADRTLADHPCGSDPVLIVRDKYDELHMFRFSHATIPPMEWLPDNMSRKLRDHGVVGPNKFDRSMWHS